MLQNVHRGGQGQTTLTALGLPNYLHELSPSSSPAATSLLQYQTQRPTTYRPILQRRNDRVDESHSQQINYRTAKSLLQALNSETQQNTNDDPSDLPNPLGSSEQTVLYDHHLPSTETIINHQHHPPQNQIKSGNSGTNGHSTTSQPFSYARQILFQGDKKVDSYIRY